MIECSFRFLIERLSCALGRCIHNQDALSDAVNIADDAAFADNLTESELLV